VDFILGRVQKLLSVRLQPMLSGGKNILGQYYHYHISGTVITPMYPQVCRNFHMLVFLLGS